MTKTLTPDEMHTVVLAFIQKHKTHASAAKALGVSKQLVGDILAGNRSALGPKIVAGLGYQEDLRYRKRTA